MLNEVMRDRVGITLSMLIGEGQGGHFKRGDAQRDLECNLRKEEIECEICGKGEQENKYSEWVGGRPEEERGGGEYLPHALLCLDKLHRSLSLPSLYLLYFKFRSPASLECLPLSSL